MRTKCICFLSIAILLPLNAQTTIGKTNGRDVTQVLLVNGMEPVILYVSGDANKETYHIATKDRDEGPFESVFFLMASPDGKRFIYAIEENGKQFLIDGTKKAGPYDDINNLTFLADGKTPTYVADIEGKRFVIAGDSRAGPFDELADRDVIASLLSRQLYSARVQNTWYILDRGSKIGPFDRQPAIVLSPDGHSYAYCKNVAGKNTLVWGTAEYDAHDGLGSIAFTPDGKNLGYIFHDGGKIYVDIGGARSGPYDNAYDLTFAPDGIKTAFCAKMNGKWFIVTGDGISEPFDYVDYPCFSADSRSLAYRATLGKTKYVLRDGEKSPPYVDIGELTWASGARALAYQARVADDPAHPGKAGWFAVLSGRAFGPYPSFESAFSVSPDGTRLAYRAIAAESGALAFFVNGEEIFRTPNDESYDRFLFDMRFAPSSALPLYTKWIDGKHYLISGDATIGPFHLILFPQAGESRDFSFQAVKDNGRIYNYLLIDNKPYVGTSRDGQTVYIDGDLILLRGNR